MHLTRGSVAVEDKDQQKQRAGRKGGKQGQGGEGIDTPSVSVSWLRQAPRTCQPEHNT